jgi:UDP-3-O-[3-hydroxymyristoyl] N-acetylglucosamine deacetylase
MDPIGGPEHTLAGPVSCTGIGLHKGKPVDLVLRPASAGTGILFVRTDLDRPARFPARAEWISQTTLATTLGKGEAALSTVEHLLAALRGMGVDNCTVEVSGPELPIMDGSAAPFVYLLREAGLRPQRRMRRRLVIRRPLEVRDGNRWVRVLPSRTFKLSVSIDYPHPAIGRNSLESLRPNPRTFASEIAPARTFGFLRDVQFPDEFVRHKTLDLIGDLALLGVPLQGHVKAMRSGHALHQALLAEIRANPSCWTIETPGSPATVPTEREIPIPVPTRVSA